MVWVQHVFDLISLLGYYFSLGMQKVWCVVPQVHYQNRMAEAATVPLGLTQLTVPRVYILDRMTEASAVIVVR